MFSKSVDFLRRSNGRNVCILSQSLQIQWLIRGMEVDKNTKFQFMITVIMLARQKTTGTWGLDTNSTVMSR